jgi:hypothetical protein
VSWRATLLRMLPGRAMVTVQGLAVRGLNVAEGFSVWSSCGGLPFGGARGLLAGCALNRSLSDDGLLGVSSPRLFFAGCCPAASCASTWSWRPLLCRLDLFPAEGCARAAISGAVSLASRSALACSCSRASCSSMTLSTSSSARRFFTLPVSASTTLPSSSTQPLPLTYSTGSFCVGALSLAFFALKAPLPMSPLSRLMRPMVLARSRCRLRVVLLGPSSGRPQRASGSAVARAVAMRCRRGACKRSRAGSQRLPMQTAAEKILQYASELSAHANCGEGATAGSLQRAALGRVDAPSRLQLAQI